MQRALLPWICGALVWVAWARPAEAAPAATSPAATSPAEDAASPENRAEPRPEDRRRARPVPRPKPYRFAEPRPQVLRKVASIKRGGKILLWSGVGLGGLGFAAVIAGAVLVGTRQYAPTRTTIGIINLIAGAALVAGGAALVGIGTWRLEVAERKLLDDKLRNLTAFEPAHRLRVARVALPAPNTVLTWQLRF